MGLGIGTKFERCGEQLSYEYMPFKAKEAGDAHDICGVCLKEIEKKNWDEKNGY